MVLPAWSLSSMGEAASWDSLTAASSPEGWEPRGHRQDPGGGGAMEVQGGGAKASIGLRRLVGKRELHEGQKEWDAQESAEPRGTMWGRRPESPVRGTWA